MYPVSQRFLDSLTGSHEAVCRARIITRPFSGTAPQFGLNPAGFEVYDVPVLDGSDVKMARTGEIKTSVNLQVPPDFWALAQPYGADVFVERGIDFGDGTQELVPFGYFRIDDVDQDDAPDGPITLSCYDRSAQLADNRVLAPLQIPAGTSHRKVFQRLVNGATLATGLGQSTEGYGTFFSYPIPITWTGYDPDTVVVTGGQVVEDSSITFLTDLAEDQGCAIRFDEAGGLLVEPLDGPAEPVIAPPVFAGEGGNLVRASRGVKRGGVYNIVSAYSSDPSVDISNRGYGLNNTHPLGYRGPFGPVTRYFASPLLRSIVESGAAAQTLVARYTGLPQTLGLQVTPNPALRPNDFLPVDIGDGEGGIVYQIEDIVCPLVGSSPMTINTRTSVVV